MNEKLKDPLTQMLAPLVDALKDVPECQEDVQNFLKHFDAFAKEKPKEFGAVLMKLIPAAQSIITRAPMYVVRGLGEKK